MNRTTNVAQHIGFTLIELMVVIAIISLLASVVIGSFTDARNTAQDTERYSNLRNVEVALERYVLEHGQYPSTGNQWWTFCTHDQDPTTRSLSGPDGYIPGLAPEYINELPVDPDGCEDRSLNYGEGHFGGYIYRSNGQDYKFSSDWGIEVGVACRPNARYWDPRRGEGGLAGNARREGISFCSIYSPGAAEW